MNVPSLKKVCLDNLDEETKTMILLHRDSYIGLYWELIALEFFKTWPDAPIDVIDKRIMQDLPDDALDIIFRYRETAPSLYYIVVENEFWETFFIF
jgi:hypothetical protein